VRAKNWTATSAGKLLATHGERCQCSPVATLFFSYSHKDEALRDELEVHLSMLKNRGLIESWHDRRILAGDQVDHTIDANLEAADIILLLVSPDFLASRYCYDVEVKRAMERHRAGKCRVIPVILRPCDWKDAPFAALLAAPKDGKPVTMWANRDEAFLGVVHQIKAGLPRVSQPTDWPPRNLSPMRYDLSRGEPSTSYAFRLF
jgi:hypothetical protein